MSRYRMHYYGPTKTFSRTLEEAFGPYGRYGLDDKPRWKRGLFRVTNLFWKWL